MCILKFMKLSSVSLFMKLSNSIEICYRIFSEILGRFFCFPELRNFARNLHFFHRLTYFSNTCKKLHLKIPLGPLSMVMEKFVVVVIVVFGKSFETDSRVKGPRTV